MKQTKIEKLGLALTSAPFTFDIIHKLLANLVPAVVAKPEDGDRFLNSSGFLSREVSPLEMAQARLSLATADGDCQAAYQEAESTLEMTTRSALAILSGRILSLALQAGRSLKTSRAAREQLDADEATAADLMAKIEAGKTPIKTPEEVAIEALKIEREKLTKIGFTADEMTIDEESRELPKLLRKIGFKGEFTRKGMRARLEEIGGDISQQEELADENAQRMWDEREQRMERTCSELLKAQQLERDLPLARLQAEEAEQASQSAVAALEEAFARCGADLEAILTLHDLEVTTLKAMLSGSKAEAGIA